MPTVKHSVQNEHGVVLSENYIGGEFRTAEAAQAFIRYVQAEFEQRGFDKKSTRWWAWNKVEPLRIEYWWIEDGFEHGHGPLT